jgi:hypothetical protein
LKCSANDDREKNEEHGTDHDEEHARRSLVLSME